MKFTQEVKDKWLKALRSGDYEQGVEDLVSGAQHCCIGVLGEITDGLSNMRTDETVSTCFGSGGFDSGIEGNYIFNSQDNFDSNPYKFLFNTIGGTRLRNLWSENDNSIDWENPDYRNVIPLIEDLPVEA